MRPDRLDAEDEKIFADTINDLAFRPKPTTSESNSMGEKDKCKLIYRSKSELLYSSKEAKRVEDVVKRIHKRYDLEVKKPIDPEGNYAPAILPGDSEIALGPAALYAYSKLLLFRDHYVETPKREQEASFSFFKHHLYKLENRIRKDLKEEWDVWFDWFWLLVKIKTWQAGNLQDYIDLHNKYWNVRVKNHSKAYGKSLLIYSDWLPSGFNDELEAIVSSSFGKATSIFGKSPLQFKCFIDALNMANDNEPCMIIGETGTGKEGIAKLIHAASYRQKNVFQAINCAGFTDSLFNSEISGVIEGVATDVKTQLGKVLSASGYSIEKKGKLLKREIVAPRNINEKAGTIFLDEINSLELNHQAKLLRILQEKEVQVLGEDISRPVELKFICAANEDLQEGIIKGWFRKDLYYRISKGIIRLPTLREMPETIVEIAQNILFSLSAKSSFPVKNLVIDEEAKEILVNHRWPGNFRELENVMYRAYIKMKQEGEQVILSRHIDLQTSETKRTVNSLDLLLEMKFKDAKKEFDKVYAYEALKRANGNKSLVNQKTGMSRSKLNDILGKHECTD